MGLSAQDRAFVARRGRLARSWPLLGVSCLVLIGAYGAWLRMKMPQMIDPWWVAERLRAGALPPSTLELMAVMLPVAILVLLALAVVVVLLMFVASRNEQRLVRLVRTLDAGGDADQGGTDASSSFRAT
ncbi:MAG: hypothetical protein KDK06_06940 [Gammaproteobacteria bacterium]|nr:hypothetical protein [Gammaproteobacteria bacterium]